jgi:hypothetical protein
MHLGGARDVGFWCFHHVPCVFPQIPYGSYCIPK